MHGIFKFNIFKLNREIVLDVSLYHLLCHVIIDAVFWLGCSNTKFDVIGF